MSELAGRRIAFLGGGAMAEALIGGLIAKGVPATHLRASDPDPSRRKHLEEQHGIETTAENADAVRECDVVVVAVKPGVVPQALAAARDAGGEPLWISIAAGVSLEALQAALSPSARVVRAMPNTPALVGEGATVFCGSAQVSVEDAVLARALFQSVGTAFSVADEGLIDAVTGLSGSGPAYVFVFLEALADAGVRVGLPRDLAMDLAAQTVYGAAKLARESDRHPAQLKDQVASPGGTTVAGLERIEAGGLRAVVYEAVAAATARSRELGSK
jgi:pyrroline-5-carboxylate reductase